ncbi:presenilins-associated rhomboid-like protein, mitochondrial [Corythoichthys intestinalis]|uniref:presenilins-associated rhomboid-like protein, mitochondrial n=1 Tax=Corythoichthys intestinalis TaxID=161448 RepID=UPI0025A5D5E9|nr:presenilins-associated rhomboid-like protein, mitochondrial [Corythoichthys intestinalis]XP_057695084.1 presenilins-associated rhomboid-like protein, mitochondrial [Corythoichthys intestinalis]XP_061797708.1 presenilin-associated rhomboid-like protein, mitochondrial [Nerophis lumbriciformis]
MAAWRNYAVLFNRTGVDVLWSVRGGSRWTQNFQQRSGFRKVARKPESKKVEDELGHLDSSEVASNRQTSSPHWASAPPPPSSGSPRAFGRLVRPLLFTVGFTGCSFGSAAIWQYESLKSRVQSYFNELRADWLERVRPQKRGDVRKEVNHWWNTLSEGQRTVTAILAANAVVFCCWRVPRLQRSMFKYFTADSASRTLCAPMVLSTFSHVSFFHMAANMYVLWSFSTSAVSMLGREQFVAVYLSAGVISTFCSYVCKMATGRFGPSLGASGAIMTILAAVCTKIPEAKLAIIFLPMFTFSAANALKAIIAMDTAGLILGWRFFDHAAHLGGAMFGIWYILFGHELIWKNREPFVKFWHELRTGRGGGNGGERGGSA